MRLTSSVFEEKLKANTSTSLLASGCLIDLVESVKSSGSKELLTIFAEHNGFERLFEQGGGNVDYLDFFLELATILVNSYDERLGIISALTYFLCERDRFSIDIQWAWKTAHRFEKFVAWLEPHLSNEKAMLLFEYILNDFPPTRVTPLMWNSVINLYPALVSAICATDDISPERISCTSDLLLSLCYFGLGLEFREYVRTDLIIYDNYFPKLKDLRCPGQDCEFLRIARKAIRSRDESPIAENSALAVNILRTMQTDNQLARAMMLDNLAKLIDNENSVLTVDVDNAILNVFALIHAWEVTYESTALQEALAADWRALDEAILRHRLVDRYFATSAGGLPRGLCVWVVYYLKRHPESDLSLVWLQMMCEQIISVQPSSARTLPFGGESVMLPVIACLHHAYTRSLQLRSDQLHVDAQQDEYCADDYVCTWNSETSKLVADALSNLVHLTDSFIQSQITPPSQDWMKRHLTHLSCALSIVCGIDEYTKVLEERRHAMLPAGGSCGYLIDTCRTCVGLVKSSDCLMVKRILDVCLMRSEQASGIRLVLK